MPPADGSDSSNERGSPATIRLARYITKGDVSSATPMSKATRQPRRSTRRLDSIEPPRTTRAVFEARMVEAEFSIFTTGLVVS